MLVWLEVVKEVLRVKDGFHFGFLINFKVSIHLHGVCWKNMCPPVCQQKMAHFSNLFLREPVNKPEQDSVCSERRGMVAATQKLLETTLLIYGTGTTLVYQTHKEGELKRWLTTTVANLEVFTSFLVLTLAGGRQNKK